MEPRVSPLSSAVLCAALCAPACRRDSPKQHAVLIVVDTFRGDVVDQARTPTIDKLGRWGGARAERAWSASTWTAPSVMSIFSGMTVREHGWDFPFPDDLPDLQSSYPPMADVPLLAEVLAAESFATAGWYNNPLLGRELGFERGFDVFERSRDRRVSGLVREYAAGADRNQRQFLYVHLFGAHQPLVITQDAADKYEIPKEPEGRKRGYGLAFAQTGDQAADIYRKAYHADVEDTDRIIRDVLDAADWIADDAVIVVTSDHGELLGEHTLWGHGAHLYEPLTHVPLVVRGGGTLPDQLSNAAVPDIITRALRVPSTWSVTTSTGFPLSSQREGQLALLADPTHKAMWGSSPAAVPQVYDLQADPGELSPLPPSTPLGGATAATVRTTWEAAVPARTLTAIDGPIDEETMKVLEALGYVE